MSVYLVFTLLVGAIAFLVNASVNEEIVKVGAVLVAGICIILSVVFAPLLLKLMLLGVPLAGKKLHLI